MNKPGDGGKKLVVFVMIGLVLVAFGMSLIDVNFTVEPEFVGMPEAVSLVADGASPDRVEQAISAEPVERRPMLLEAMLIESARSGNIPVLRWAIEDKGLDPNLQHGAPLHFAVLGREIEAVECLLKNGADPEVRLRSGRTLLNSVQYMDNQEILTLLREAAAGQVSPEENSEAKEDKDVESPDPPSDVDTGSANKSNSP